MLRDTPLNQVPYVLVLRLTLMLLLLTPVFCASGASSEETCKIATDLLTSTFQRNESVSCQHDSECGQITLCPIGCFQPVRKDKIQEIKRLHKEMVNVCGRGCIYECIPIAVKNGEPAPRIVCHKNRCKWSNRRQESPDE